MIHPLQIAGVALLGVVVAIAVLSLVVDETFQSYSHSNDNHNENEKKKEKGDENDENDILWQLKQVSTIRQRKGKSLSGGGDDLNDLKQQELFESRFDSPLSSCFVDSNLCQQEPSTTGADFIAKEKKAIQARLALLEEYERSSALLKASNITNKVVNKTIETEKMNLYRDALIEREKLIRNVLENTAHDIDIDISQLRPIASSDLLLSSIDIAPHRQLNTVASVDLSSVAFSEVPVESEQSASQKGASQKGASVIGQGEEWDVVSVSAGSLSHKDPI